MLDQFTCSCPHGESVLEVVYEDAICQLGALSVCEITADVHKAHPTEVLLHACAQAWQRLLPTPSLVVQVNDVSIPANELGEPEVTAGFLAFPYKDFNAPRSPQMKALLSFWWGGHGDGEHGRRVSLAANRWTRLHPSRTEEAQTFAADLLHQASAVTFRVQGCRKKDETILLQATAFVLKKSGEMVNLEIKLVKKGLAAPTRAARAARCQNIAAAPLHADCITHTYHRLIFAAYDVSAATSLLRDEAWINWGYENSSSQRLGRSEIHCVQRVCGLSPKESESKKVIKQVRNTTKILCDASFYTYNELFSAILKAPKRRSKVCMYFYLINFFPLFTYTS